MAIQVRIHEHGGPEVLRTEEVALPDPGPREARVRQTAIGLNFIDVYHRTGLYPVPAFPSGIGLEAAGTVVAVGDGVTEVRPGDRVAYADGPLGAYASERNIPADRLVRLPEEIDDVTAAAMMVKGLTAQYLLRRTYRVRPGETILVYAAAGGVGLILCQWAAHLGARVIGVVGSDEKAAIAGSHGCAHVIVSAREDVPSRVRELTDGRGVPVVYDSVGRATFDASLACLSPLGLMVSYGNASGPVPPFPISRLTAAGSLFLTRPSLATYVALRSELLDAARELFEVVRSGVVRVEVNQTWPLREAARAHAELEARRTTGSTVLLP